MNRLSVVHVDRAASPSSPKPVPMLMMVIIIIICCKQTARSCGSVTTRVSHSTDYAEFMRSTIVCYCCVSVVCVCVCVCVCFCLASSFVACVASHLASIARSLALLVINLKLIYCVDGVCAVAGVVAATSHQHRSSERRARSHVDANTHTHRHSNTHTRTLGTSLFA